VLDFLVLQVEVPAAFEFVQLARVAFDAGKPIVQAFFEALLRRRRQIAQHRHVGGHAVSVSVRQVKDAALSIQRHHFERDAVVVGAQRSLGGLEHQLQEVGLAVTTS
jgi:hypothetical protein